MTDVGRPPVHVTSDVTAAFLSQPPTAGKAPPDRQQSLAGHYTRPDDVGDVLLQAGNDYFHQHRRHQFRDAAPPWHRPAMMAAPLDLQPAGTCRPDVEHIYESPNHDGPARAADSPSVTGRQLDDSYYSEHDLRLAAS